MNQSLTRRMAAVLAASSVTALSSVPLAPAAPPKPPTAAVWSPDKALAAKLAPPVDLAGYKMRLPADCTAELKKDQVSGPVRVRVFSVRREDDAGPSMFIITMSPATAAGVSALPATAQRLLDGDAYVHGHADWIKAVPMVGRVNGLQAARQYFKYTRADGRVTHGFHYGVVDGAKRLLVDVVDEAPRSETSLPLAEAAVLTLRK